MTLTQILVSAVILVLMYLLGLSTGKYVALGLGIGALQYFDPKLPIPTWVDWLMLLVGVGFLRLGVAKQSKLAQDTLTAVTALMQVYVDVASKVTVPSPINSLPSPSGQTPSQEQAETKTLNEKAASGVR